MIIEFELQGTKGVHKGIFDTTGFWIKYEEDICSEIKGDEFLYGYKLFSHFSFSFYHTEKKVVDDVYSVLIGCMRGNQGKDIPGVGYIRKLNK